MTTEFVQWLVTNLPTFAGLVILAYVQWHQADQFRQLYADLFAEYQDLVDECLAARLRDATAEGGTKPPDRL